MHELKIYRIKQVYNGEDERVLRLLLTVNIHTLIKGSIVFLLVDL